MRTWARKAQAQAYGNEQHHSEEGRGQDGIELVHIWRRGKGCPLMRLWVSRYIGIVQPEIHHGLKKLVRLDYVQPKRDNHSIMKSEALLIPFAKIKRAETQIHNLKNSIKEFFDRKPYRITSDTDLQVGELVWKFEFTECIPIEFSISIGEILHNLRSPLDQICCELALMNGRTETKVYFPFGGDKKGFETSLREQKKLPSDARDFIKKIEPYSGGAGHVLWALNQLNRRDKHRVGLVPMNTNTVVRMKELKVDGARVIRVGSRRGKHMLCDPATNNLVQPDTTKAPRFRDDDGVKSIEFGPLADNPVYDDMEIMTTFPGARVKIDAEPHFDIAFREIEMDGQPTVAVLNDMRDSVGRILRAFETRFFA